MENHFNTGTHDPFQVDDIAKDNYRQWERDKSLIDRYCDVLKLWHCCFWYDTSEGTWDGGLIGCKASGEFKAGIALEEGGGVKGKEIVDPIVLRKAKLPMSAIDFTQSIEFLPHMTKEIS